MSKRRSQTIQATELAYPAPGVTFQKQNTADAVETFAEDDYSSGNKQAVKARILVDTNNARTARGVDPVSGGLGYLRAEGDEFWLEGLDDITDFRFINDVGAEQVTLTVTMYYPS